MKKILFILSLFISFVSFGQSGRYQQMPQAGYGPIKRILIDTVLTIPTGIESLRNIPGGRDTAQLRYNKADSSLYVYSGYQWIKSPNETYLQRYIDSVIAINNYYTGNSTCLPTLLDGSIIWVNGFNFSNTKLKYLIGCQLDSVDASNFSISAADTTDRYTIIYADTLGQLHSQDGSTGAVASIPTIDPRSQVLLATYFIPANSTQPQLLSNTTVYKENVEWVGSSNISGIDFAATSPTPYQGLYSTYAPSISAGKTISFTNGTDNLISGVSFVSFYIRLSTAYTNNIYVNLINNGSWARYVAVNSGRFGFNGSLLNQWQLIVIPIYSFGVNLNTNTFQNLEFYFDGSGGALQLDNIILQGGGNNQSTTGVQTINGATNNVYIRQKYNADSSFTLLEINGVNQPDSLKTLKSWLFDSTGTQIVTIGVDSFAILATGSSDTANNLTTVTAAIDSSYFSVNSINNHYRVHITNGTILSNISSEISLPSTLYLLDTVIDLFYKPIAKNFFKQDKFIRVTATNSSTERQFQQLITITPTASGVATFNLYSDQFVLQSSTAVNTVVTSKVKTGALKTVFIGDSFTYDSRYLNKINSRCPSGITFEGIRHSSISSTGVFHEGRGGFTIDQYFAVTPYDYPHNPFYHPVTGRYWGNTAFWAWVMTHAEFTGDYNRDGFLTTGTAVGMQTTGYPTSPTTGDYVYDESGSTYKQWNGSTWATVSAPTSWEFSFVKYSSMWGQAVPDVVFVMLGLNDFRTLPLPQDYTTYNNEMTAILTALKVANASGKLGVIIPISSLGTSMAGLEFTAQNDFNMWHLRKNIIDTFDNRTGEDFYIVDAGIAFDDVYGYEYNTWDTTTIIKPNAQYTGSEVLRVQYANPHPSPDGYNLLGNMIAGFIQYIR